MTHEHALVSARIVRASATVGAALLCVPAPAQALELAVQDDPVTVHERDGDREAALAHAQEIGGD
jgi:hypothetical protein